MVMGRLLRHGASDWHASCCCCPDLSRGEPCRDPQVSSRAGLTPSGILWRTYLKVYRTNILIHFFWAFAEVGCR